MELDEYCSQAEKLTSKKEYQKAFDIALEGLQHFEHTDSHSEECYNTLFRFLISTSRNINETTDYNALVKQQIEACEKKFGVQMDLTEDTTLEDDAKWAADEKDANHIIIKYGKGASVTYKILREVVRFTMYRNSVLNNMDHEVCCTETNFANVMGRIRGDLEKIVPPEQRQFLDSMGQSIYSDFTSLFLFAGMDLIVDALIYEMKEFRPLQLNIMGKEIRTNIGIVKSQLNKEQKSQTVTGWFKTMLILPAFLFRKLYMVNFVDMFEGSEKQIQDAARMFHNYELNYASFVVGDEYKILKDMLEELGLSDCFTIRPKFIKVPNKPVVN